MKILVVLSAATAACLAAPAPAPAPGFLSGVAAPLAALPPAPYAAGVAFPAAAPLALASQFRPQDGLGQYGLGYLAGSRALDGAEAGGYSYVDADGALQAARYVADPLNVFRAAAATNLPAAAARQVQDTPEVTRARAAHAAFAADAAARSAAPAPSTPAPAAAPEARSGQQGAAAPPAATSYANIVLGPGGVPLDTPEVAAARAADAVAHLQAKAAALFG